MHYVAGLGQWWVCPVFSQRIDTQSFADDMIQSLHAEKPYQFFFWPMTNGSTFHGYLLIPSKGYLSTRQKGKQNESKFSILCPTLLEKQQIKTPILSFHFYAPVWLKPKGRIFTRSSDELVADFWVRGIKCASISHSSESANASWEIAQVTLKDEGYYECIAVNSAGTGRARTFLDVSGKHTYLDSLNMS